MCMFQVSLVRGLPVEDHLATSMVAEPLRISIMEVFNVSLEIVFPRARLLDIFLLAETARERALLFPNR